ncbi:MAG TPA: YraN family protein [Phycisphaerales bacterium]|nr:YraN family protein [Phycisphaerales bacterium]
MERATGPSRRGWMGRLGDLLRGRATDGRDPLGPEGERVAARHLRGLGYRVIGSNLRVPMGEADVLAIGPDGETVVLVEVKSRRVDPEGDRRRRARGEFVAPPPEASITARKREKLALILRHLARANGWTARPLRIDAVAVEWPPGGEPVVRHHENAVPLMGQ